MFIRLNGIKLFAHHGVYEDEIKHGNNLEVDLEVEAADTLGATDSLAETLDYTALYKTVMAVSQNRRYNLLEAFSSDICMRILESFPAVKYAKVKVRKMNPPIGGEIKNVEVEFQKGRTNA